MAGNITDLQKLLNKASNEIPQKALIIMEVEAMAFINKNFRDQGFNNSGVEKWKKRKTTDRNGRDLTRYRSNRVGIPGELTKFGQREKGRHILIGHNTGGDKLWRSFRAKKEKDRVRIFTYKRYAQRHNEGLNKMPRRQFIGKSIYLENKIKDKITIELDKIFR